MYIYIYIYIYIYYICIHLSSRFPVSVVHTVIIIIVLACTQSETTQNFAHELSRKDIYISVIHSVMIIIVGLCTKLLRGYCHSYFLLLFIL